MAKLFYNGVFDNIVQHVEMWPKDHVICVHAEERTVAAVLLLAELYQKNVHVCHVARKEEVRAEEVRIGRRLCLLFFFSDCCY